MNTKATILAAAVLALASAGAFAQGTISFVNTASTLVTTNNGQTTGASTSGFGSKIQLLYIPDTGQSAPTVTPAGGSGFIAGALTGGWELAGTPVSVGSPLAGRFGSVTETTGNDVAQQGNVWLMAVAWNGGATSYANATTATYAGVSAVWSQATGGGAVLPVNTTGFSGLQLLPVPEPSTIALAGLGAASLLLFRRRK
jgi:hypothetical protein